MNGRIQEIINDVKNVGGWLTNCEGEFLYYSAKRCQGKGIILEIGSWKGKSTIWLAKGSKDGNSVKIHAIDPHIGSSEHHKMFGKVDTYKEFLSNIKDNDVNDIIIPYKETSESVAKEWNGEPIEFLWIDGGHEYELVKLDYELWEPFLIEGGVIAFHDTYGGGPWRVVRDNLFKGNKFKNVGFVGQITFGTKVKKLETIDKIRNYISFILRIAFILTHIIIRKLNLPIYLEELRIFRYPHSY